MKHLKRFKNWFVVVYYACFKISEQVRHDLQNSKPSATDVVQGDEAKLDNIQTLEAKTQAQPPEMIEASQTPASMQQPVAEKTEKLSKRLTERTAERKASEVAIKEQSPKAAPEKVTKTESKDNEVQKRTVQQQSGQPQTAPPAPKVEAKVTLTPKVTPQNTAVITEQPASKGKYQPGAINDQTAQRLARLLVSEIKLYQKSKTEGEDACEMNNIYDLLKDPIEKSRQHYKQRMGAKAIESMPDYFHNELVRTLCGGDVTRLGANYPSDR